MAKDVALFNILTNNLMSVAREMSADFLRSAYSVVIREAADCSTCLLYTSSKRGTGSNNRAAFYICLHHIYI